MTSHRGKKDAVEPGWIESDCSNESAQTGLEALVEQGTQGTTVLSTYPLWVLRSWAELALFPYGHLPCSGGPECVAVVQGGDRLASKFDCLTHHEHFEARLRFSVLDDE